MYLEADLRRIFDGKRVLIAGMGREGKSALALLNRLGVCAAIDSADNDETTRTMLTDGNYDLVVKSPGIPMRVLQGMPSKTTVTSMTDIFLRVYGDQVVGVTGTKGKSTTSSLIYHILKEAGYNVLLGGNIGIPLFELIEQMSLSTIVVAELSCHQLEGIHRGPHIALLLNLFEEHLDHYDNYEAYKMAKMQIGLRQVDGDCFIYCNDNQELSSMVEKHRGQFRSSLAAYSLRDQSPYGEMPSQLPGDHNKSNIIAAATVAQQYFIDDNALRKAVANFTGLEHRLEYVGTYAGIRFYNDSISTIPAACEAAVRSLGNVQTLVLGGFDRGIDYGTLADFIASSSVENIALVGSAGERIGRLLDTSHPNHGKQLLHCNDYPQIVAWCFEVTAPGKACLLSPAAASYDTFKNFEERGQVFKQLVRRHVRQLLHAHPGLSGNECFAHDLIVRSLSVYPDCTIYPYLGGKPRGGLRPLTDDADGFFGRVDGYGIVAVFGDNKSAPTIAFRADTDALPIDEPATPAPTETNAPIPPIDPITPHTQRSPACDHRSQTPGVSHKCGHDGPSPPILPDKSEARSVILISSARLISTLSPTSCP